MWHIFKLDPGYFKIKKEYDYLLCFKILLYLIYILVALYLNNSNNILKPKDFYYPFICFSEKFPSLSFHVSVYSTRLMPANELRNIWKSFICKPLLPYDTKMQCSLKYSQHVKMQAFLLTLSSFFTSALPLRSLPSPFFFSFHLFCPSLFTYFTPL